MIISHLEDKVHVQYMSCCIINPELSFVSLPRSEILDRIGGDFDGVGITYLVVMVGVMEAYTSGGILRQSLCTQV